MTVASAALAQTSRASLDCENAGTIVMNTRATVARTAPSVRQGLVISGPEIDVFVDRATCNVVSP